MHAYPVGTSRVQRWPTPLHGPTLRSQCTVSTDARRSRTGRRWATPPRGSSPQSRSGRRPRLGSPGERDGDHRGVIDGAVVRVCGPPLPRRRAYLLQRSAADAPKQQAGGDLLVAAELEDAIGAEDEEALRRLPQRVRRDLGHRRHAAVLGGDVTEGAGQREGRTARARRVDPRGSAAMRQCPDLASLPPDSFALLRVVGFVVARERGHPDGPPATRRAPLLAAFTRGEDGPRVAQVRNEDPGLRFPRPFAGRGGIEHEGQCGR
mmetsp:Transcript_70522/g.206387  ORF Transcript_70522/g.206387 Transcript_70522/m.206387 type:complete len:264 (-) Transcript_70522:172-963(-)